MSALVAGLAGCGESGNDLLPERSASRLLEFVEATEVAMSNDQCVEARQAARDGRNRALELPRRVDDDLQANLVDWFEHLEDEARKECNRRRKSEATPTPTATAEPTEDPTEEPTEEPTAEPTEEPTAEPTTEPTAEPTPADEEQGFGAEDEG